MLRKVLWTGLYGALGAAATMAALPKNAEPGAPPAPRAPSGPQHAKQKKPGAGPHPLVVAGAAFGIGSLLAKIIDWRGHAHPRR